MARVSNDEYRIDEVGNGDVLDFDAPDTRVQADPLALIHDDVKKLVEGAFDAGKLRVKVIAGFADRKAALAHGAKIVRQAKKYGEVRPAGRITVGATVVENFVRPDGKGTIPVVVTMVAKEYKPRPRKESSDTSASKTSKTSK